MSKYYPNIKYLTLKRTLQRLDKSKHSQHRPNIVSQKQTNLQKSDDNTVPALARSFINHWPNIGN